MQKVVIGVLVALVLALGGAGYWFYQGYLQKAEKPAPEAIAVSYLEALQARDAAAVFEQSTDLGPKVLRIMGQGKSVTGESPEQMLESARADWSPKFQLAAEKPGALLAFERNLTPNGAVFETTDVGGYQAEFHKQIQGQDAIELIERMEELGQEELVYVHVEYKDPATAPSCGDIPNCRSDKGRKIKSAVLELQATSASTNPKYWAHVRWFRENEKSYGHLPGWEMAKTYFLTADTWTFRISPYLDMQKVRFR